MVDMSLPEVGLNILSRSSYSGIFSQTQIVVSYSIQCVETRWDLCLQLRLSCLFHEFAGSRSLWFIMHDYIREYVGIVGEQAAQGF